MRLLLASCRTTIALSGVFLLFFAQSAFPVSAPNALSVEQWRSDLHYLAEQIPKVHPHPFHSISRSDFEAAVARVDARIPTLSDHEVELELVRLVALLGEGHSRISLPGQPDPMSDVPEITPAKDPRFTFSRLPIRLYSFSDGLYVVGTARPFRSLLGARVEKIGGLPVADVLDAVKPLVNRDNEMGLRLVGPDLVTIPEVLQALHVGSNPERVQFEFEEGTGNHVESVLTPLSADSAADRADLEDLSRTPPPLYLRHANENFWNEYLAPTRTVYVGINVIDDMPSQSLAQFAQSLAKITASKPVEKLVIDLRRCHGGNNQLFRSLLLWLIRDSKINQPGKLFIVIGRATFSAAVNAAGDLEHLVNAISVGEPTGGAPSSWGDPKRVVLPNSGLIARISTVYWRDSSPDMSRPWIAPDIHVVESSADRALGRDPVMDAISRFEKPENFSTVLESLLKAGAGADSIVRMYYQHKTDGVWAGESTQQALQGMGERYLDAGSFGNALLMFRLNLRDDPESIGAALRAAEQRQTRQPNDKGLADVVNRLRELQSRH
jgi:hypothetical protein